MSVTFRNDQMIDGLKAEFFGRSEPNCAAANGLPTIKMIPALRGIWAMSGALPGITTAIPDETNNGVLMTMTNGPTLSADNLAPYIQFTRASSQYTVRVDFAGIDITGTETYVDASVQGLSMGAFVYFNALGNAEGIISKFTSPNQRSYRMYKDINDDIVFEVSVDGVTIVGVTSADAVTDNQWYHVMARYIPSTEMSVWVNGIETVRSTGVPASIFNSTADLHLGRTDAGNYMGGRMSLAWLASSAPGDSTMLNSYWQAKTMYDILT